ncbi:MAG: NAD-dependent epimerase/dehydratase family protein [Thermaurantimonas sp.]
MNILVTGSAGFIGFHLVYRLTARFEKVFGLDNINDYYDPNLKYARLQEAGIDECSSSLIASHIHPNYTFIKADPGDRPTMERICKK